MSHLTLAFRLFILCENFLVNILWDNHLVDKGESRRGDLLGGALSVETGRPDRGSRESCFMEVP